MKLYGHPISGHAHRAKALLHILAIEFEDIVLDLKAGAHKAPEFLALNPLGQVPVLVDGDLVLRDSTAILVYLAQKFDPSGRWLPSDPKAQAQVQQWLSAASLELREGPFALRGAKLFGRTIDHEAARTKTENLFGQLFEPHLSRHSWLVGSEPTIADLACYSYIARAPEGDFSLEPYPRLRAWLERVEAIDNFWPMPRAEATR